MPDLNIRRVSDSLIHDLKTAALAARMTLREYVLESLTRSLESGPADHMDTRINRQGP